MKVKSNQLSMYSAGYKAGCADLKEQTEKAYEQGMKEATIVCINSILLSLYYVGWGKKDIDTVSGMIADAIVYNGEHADEMKIDIESMRNALGIEIKYTDGGSSERHEERRKNIN